MSRQILTLVFDRLPTRMLVGTLPYKTSLVVQWSESLTTNHEVPGSIPGSTVGIFLEGEDSRGDHGLGRLVEFRFKAPPGTTSSSITTRTSPGQRKCASWASQPQKSVTLLPCPGGRTTKSTKDMWWHLVGGGGICPFNAHVIYLRLYALCFVEYCSMQDVLQLVQRVRCSSVHRMCRLVHRLLCSLVHKVWNSSCIECGVVQYRGCGVVQYVVYGVVQYVGCGMVYYIQCGLVQ